MLVLRVLAGLLAVALIALALSDAFATVVAARRANRIFRITGLFFRLTWSPYVALARRIRSGRLRENYLSVYGPVSLLLLLGSWAATLILGFGLLQWSVGLHRGAPWVSVAADIYFSGTTFFTMGFAEPATTASKALMVVEVAIGYSFLGLIIGYPPVLYGFFSQREWRISLLDARAGSPPSAGELVIRQGRNPDSLERQLAEWEEWEASVLQSHLSYPMLAYFRSQHTNESWLGALTTIVDASALTLVAAEGNLRRQAQLTFAMGRHALVDLTAVFNRAPLPPNPDRLNDEDLARMRRAIASAPTALRSDALVSEELIKLRAMYEPYANALATHFLIALPPWFPKERKRDNWEATSWDRKAAPFAVSDPFIDS